MAQLFGHEKLKVYQKGMEFAAIRSKLLDGLPRRVAACDHLDRAAESMHRSQRSHPMTLSPTLSRLHLVDSLSRLSACRPVRVRTQTGTHRRVDFASHVVPKANEYSHGKPGNPNAWNA